MTYLYDIFYKDYVPWDYRLKHDGLFDPDHNEIIEFP